MDSMDLSAKIALVTGGSRGIGRAICRRLAEAGAAVAVNYSDTAPADLVAEGEPDDIAGPVVFLASDAARYVNGAALLVDGGLFVNLR